MVGIATFFAVGLTVDVPGVAFATASVVALTTAAAYGNRRGLVSSLAWRIGAASLLLAVILMIGTLLLFGLLLDWQWGELGELERTADCAVNCDE